jgi:hypothetical protein
LPTEKSLTKRLHIKKMSLIQKVRSIMKINKKNTLLSCTMIYEKAVKKEIGKYLIFFAPKNIPCSDAPPSNITRLSQHLNSICSVKDQI